MHKATLYKDRFSKKARIKKPVLVLAFGLS